MEEIMYAIGDINDTLTAVFGKNEPWQTVYDHNSRDSFKAYITYVPQIYDFKTGVILFIFIEPATSTYDNRHADRQVLFFEERNEAVREATRQYEAWLEEETNA